jgi:hypothetical protein
MVASISILVVTLIEEDIVVVVVILVVSVDEIAAVDMTELLAM